MSWPGTELTEREEPKAGAVRVFWGREHKWTGSKWEPTEGRKKAEPAPARARAKAPAPEKGKAPAKAAPAKEPEAAPTGKSEEATVLEKYKLKITGPGHEKLAKAVEKGITKAADLCKINPPICKGNLGRARSTMPQFPDDEVRDSFLAKMKKQGIRVTEGKVKVGQLKASQDEIQAKKTIGMAGSYLDGTFAKIKNAIVVSKDGYIVDGHHRWAALLTVNPGEEMNVIRVGMPIKPLLELVNDHEGVEKRSMAAASIGQEKKQEDARYELAAALLEKLPARDDHQAASAELVGMLREYGSPVVAEPRRSAHYAPHGNYRVTPADKMASSRRRRRRSGREQPFIDPEDFTAQEDRYAPLSAALDSFASSPRAQERVKRDWRELAPPLAERQAGPFDALFELVAPHPRGGRTGKLAYTAYPASVHGVGVSPSAAPADPNGAGRHENYADGPVIRRRKPGYKPRKAGAGSMVPRKAEGS